MPHMLLFIKKLELDGGNIFDLCNWLRLKLELTVGAKTARCPSVGSLELWMPESM
jgi:hypothetical protein